MTKASLRRQREQEESAAAEVKDQPQTPSQPLNTPVQRPDVPRMDSPPPYDAPHLPPHFRNTQSPGQDQADRGPGCWNSGSGKADGCMNYSSGNRGPDFVVDGCCNYDSPDGCMNYRSEDGCMNYKSHDGCMNYNVSTGGGCMNYRSSRGGCLQFGPR